MPHERGKQPQSLNLRPQSHLSLIPTQRTPPRTEKRYRGEVGERPCQRPSVFGPGWCSCVTLAGPVALLAIVLSGRRSAPASRAFGERDEGTECDASPPDADTSRRAPSTRMSKRRSTVPASSAPPRPVTHRRRRQPRVRRSRAPAARSPHLTLGHRRRQIPHRTVGRATPELEAADGHEPKREYRALPANRTVVAEDRPACDNGKMSPGEPTIIKGHCPSCGGGCKAYVRGEHAIHSTDPDDGISARDVGMVLECCGCERIYFRRDFWLSEWESCVETSYWPAPVRRQRPTWFEKIEASERELGMLLDEMYTALDNDLRVLAAIAARTVFDCASQLLGVDPATDFKENLRSLCAKGRIGSDEKETLKTLVDAGSAAVHRGWRPTVDEISTMVGVVETFIHRSLVLGGGIEKLKASVPARPKKTPKGVGA